MSLNGIILKGIAGFYYVLTDSGLYECKAKGVFRKRNLVPLAGDRVVISVRESEDNTIDEILDRKNFFVRPPVANVDYMIMVSSVIKPVANTVIIDKMTAIAESKGIEPIIVFTKSDLSDTSELNEIYRKAGFKTFEFGAESSLPDDFLHLFSQNKICFFTGNSGVGKSTLINKINPEFDLATSDISEKLGRGKHTTRTAELLPFKGGYIVDTPGFSSLDFTDCASIEPEDLQFYFREFKPFLNTCLFSDCSHICEKGCSIVEAVNNGSVSRSRHDSYCQIYKELKDSKKW